MTNEITLKTQSQAIKVAGQIVYPSIDSSASWRELVAYFIAEQQARQSSKKLYLKTITRFFAWIEETGRDLSKLTRIDIAEYKDYLFPDQEENRKVSALTAGSYLVVVRKFFAWAESYKIYPNIASSVKTPKKVNTFKKKYLHEEEIFSLFDLQDTKVTQGDKCSLRDRAIITLMVYTGLRTIEVSRANIGDFDIESGRRILRIWGKGRDDKDRRVVINEEVYSVIMEYLKSRKGYSDNDPLFVSESRRGSKTANLRLTTKTISTICKRGLQAIGLDSRSYTAHSLRHTAGSLTLKNGGSQFDVMDLLGHSSVMTSQIYLNMIKEEQRVINAPEDILAKALRRH